MFLVHPTLTDKEIKKTCNIFDDLSVMDSVHNNYNYRICIMRIFN